MPKSRGRRKPAGKSQPTRRPTAAMPPARADRVVSGRYKVGRGSSVSDQIGGLLLSDEVPPDLMVELLPALLWLEHARRHPRNLCVSACITLQHAYAELGIAAHPRAVDLVVSDQHTGAKTFFGRPDPYWTDTVFHGHCVLWLPGNMRIIDPTVEQYPQIRHYRLGPICGRAAATSGPREHRAALARGKLPGGSHIGVRRGDLLLLYTVVDDEFDDVVTSAPAVTETAAEAERSGRNLASETELLLGRPEVLDRARQTPHPRVRALLDVLASMQGELDADDNWRFTLPDGTTPRLDEIVLPTSTIPDPHPPITGSVTSPLEVDAGPTHVSTSTPASTPAPDRRGLFDAVQRWWGAAKR